MRGLGDTTGLQLVTATKKIYQRQPFSYLHPCALLWRYPTGQITALSCLENRTQFPFTSAEYLLNPGHPKRQVFPSSLCFPDSFVTRICVMYARAPNGAEASKNSVTRRSSSLQGRIWVLGHAMEQILPGKMLTYKSC